MMERVNNQGNQITGNSQACQKVSSNDKNGDAYCTQYGVKPLQNLKRFVGEEREISPERNISTLPCIHAFPATIIQCSNEKHEVGEYCPDCKPLIKPDTEFLTNTDNREDTEFSKPLLNESKKMNDNCKIIKTIIAKITSIFESIIKGIATIISCIFIGIISTVAIVITGIAALITGIVAIIPSVFIGIIGISISINQFISNHRYGIMTGLMVLSCICFVSGVLGCIIIPAISGVMSNPMAFLTLALFKICFPVLGGGMLLLIIALCILGIYRDSE